MRVIGTVGMPGSGKSEAATVAANAGIPVLVMGDVIRQECRDRGLDPAQHHGRIAQALRDEHGPGAIAHQSLPIIEDHLTDATTVLVDGIRSDVEVTTFRDAFGDDFTLVHVSAPRELRKARIENRDRPGDTDGEPLDAREDRERGFGMDDAIDLADVRIENTDSLDAFHDAVRDLLAADTPHTEVPDNHD
ncbi:MULTISPECIES: AAA family ATPase [Halobacterium]|uniref:AAA family ATPase n=1 Tax=Halobacterium TaxID=2239 RepID=UPI00196579D9|nr:MULTISPECIES: AAA family ATPase [Halobacterium]MCF2164288.1 AAA family ATPase [Halobacterium salinarum]MCF2167075.1 AAA family ATPase [Halobacterium salinarum]MCF2239129.1 AAA family ATPase [Halobacterium salinarum]QRY22590.1 AAA family ATPase [Halobacterium sp. GSL-19]